MKGAGLILALSMAAAPAMTAAQAQEFNDLTPGRYAVGVSGMLTHACARALALELGRLPEVSQASADFETEEGILTVKDGGLLRVSSLRRALDRAARRVNLGSDFELRSVRYLP